MSASLESVLGKLVLVTNILLLLFLVLPILVIIPISFNDLNLVGYPIGEVSLRWYRGFISSDQWQRALKNSLVVGLTTVAIATPLGYLAAVGLYYITDKRLRALVNFFLVLPIMVPAVVSAVGMYYAFNMIGIAGSQFGVALAHTSLAIPFAVIASTASLVNLDRSMLHAAESLGASHLRTIWSVILPNTIPGIFAAALFSFATSWDEVVIALFLTGPDGKTIPVQMYSGLREEFSPMIAVVGTILFFTTIIVVVGIEVLSTIRQRRAREAKPVPAEKDL